MKCTKILAALLIGLLAAIIWLGVKSNHNDEQNNNVIETPSIEENKQIFQNSKRTISILLLILQFGRSIHMTLAL